MLNRFTRHLYVGVASNGVAIASTNKWRPGYELLEERSIDASDDVSAIASTLQDALDVVRANGETVSVVLSNKLVRQWQSYPSNAVALGSRPLRNVRRFGMECCGLNVFSFVDLCPETGCARTMASSLNVRYLG